MKLVILGRIPSKKNSRINTRSGMSFPSSKYTAWHKDASTQLSIQKIEPFKTGQGVNLTFYMPDNRRTDLTNKAESVMDLLVDNGILDDDSWQITGTVGLFCQGIDKENPRVEISWNNPEN